MEYWDIYDREKHVTGRRMIRNDWHMKPGDYHLTVLALIRDRAGRILITQRKADKEWAPLKWEIPGGGVRAGERSEEAVLREVAEETGLHFTMEQGRCIHTYRSDSPAEQNNYFVDIYEFWGDLRGRMSGSRTMKSRRFAWPARRRSVRWVSAGTSCTTTGSRACWLARDPREKMHDAPCARSCQWDC